MIARNIILRIVSAAVLLGLVGTDAGQGLAEEIKIAPVLMSRQVTVEPVQKARIEAMEKSIFRAPMKKIDEPALRPSMQVLKVPVAPTVTKEIGKLYQADVTAQQERLINRQLISQQDIRAEGDKIVPLPGVLMQRTAAGQELLLKPYIIPQRLRRGPGGLFVGSIKVGVSEISGDNAPRALSVPIMFEIVENIVARPERINVRRTGVPLARIEISAKNAPGGLTVRVASQFTPEGVPVRLEMAPTFEIAANPTMEGLGLEESTLNVAVDGVEKPEGMRVRLNVKGPVRFENPSVTLDEFGNGDANYRSTGVGGAVISASLSGFEVQKTNVVASFPVLTIAACLLGGIVGGLIRILPKAETRTRRAFTLGLLTSTLSGTLVFALYAVGVNLLPFAPSVSIGAVLVFAVSAAGAYFGAALFSPA